MSDCLERRCSGVDSLGTVLRWIAMAFVVGCLSGVAGFGAEDASGPHVLWYRQPAEQWVEALPIGNGRLGAMIFGGVAQEKLQLNEDTLWSGGPKDWNNPDAKRWLPRVRAAIFAGDYAKADELCKHMQGPYNESYLPLGDLVLEFDHAGPYEDYRRQLDLDRAVATTRYRMGDVTYTREYFASYPEQVIVMSLRASQPHCLSFTVSLSSPVYSKTTAPLDYRLLMRVHCPTHVEPDYRSVTPAVVYDKAPEGDGMRAAAYVQVTAQGGSVSPDHEGRLRVEDANEVLLIVSADTSFNGYDKSPFRQGVDPTIEALARLRKSAYAPFALLLERHLKDYQPLFRRVRLDLGPGKGDMSTEERLLAYPQGNDSALEALVFQYGRYLLIASSRLGSQPANLQGIWNPYLRPPWSSNWTLNINSEMNYWPSEVTNLPECHEPMLHFISDLARNGQKTARINYGLRGWVAHHNADLWRQSAPVGDYGEGAPTWANFAMGGVWHCMDLWEHYAFGRDRRYLRHFAYPLMKDAARFCLDWLVEDDAGHLVTAPSCSTENEFRYGDKTAMTSMASTQDMALIRDLFGNCIEASELLDLPGDEPFRAELEAARAKLYPYRVGKRGQLQEWFQDFDEPSPTHRHLSHLIGAFPGKQITPEDTPELAAAVRRSLELRTDESTGWSMAWKVNLWARLKEGNRAHKILGNLLRLTGSSKTNYEGGGIYPNLFDAHPPFQIDGNFGATAGIAEMLLQSHRRTPDRDYIVELLPALPGAWPAGKIQGLRARGGFVVDVTWSEGTLTEASIRSDVGGRCVVTYRQSSIQISLDPGGSRTLGLEDFFPQDSNGLSTR